MDHGEQEKVHSGAELWSNHAPSQIDLLRTCTRFSYGESEDDSGTPNQWDMVGDFVDAVNAHREKHVYPTDLIWVDESMSRWYGLGGDWIDVGLPTYRAIDRKPEDGVKSRIAHVERVELCFVWRS